MKILYLLMCIFSCFSLSGQETFRSWTDVQGRTVSAKYIKLSGSNVIIEREADRRKMTFPLGRLSQSDQSYVKQMQAQAAKSMSRNDYKGMLLREKKWTNRVGDSFQRFFFAFKLDKVDNDKDGIPEGEKVIVQQLWHGGRESALKAKIIMEQACVGSWRVDDSGKLEIDLGKCYPDKTARLGYYSGGPDDFRYWLGAGYSPRSICYTKTAHPHNSTCGCPFEGTGEWQYDPSSKSFKGSSNNDSWNTTIYPFKTALELK